MQETVWFSNACDMDIGHSGQEHFQAKWIPVRVKKMR
jgi:hypothetical protein